MTDDAPRTTHQTINQITAELRAIGVRPGSACARPLLSALLGPVPGGAETAIQGLLDALGPDGTLLMPALSYARVTPEQPFFDVRLTPSNVGVLPEYFARGRARCAASIRRTPFAALAGWRRELLDRHIEDRTPCGPRSPFHLLPEYGGQILMLGCGLRPNTLMHAVEELVEPSYLFGGTLAYRLVGWDWGVTEAVYCVHGFHGGQQRYDRVADVLGNRTCRVGVCVAARSPFHRDDGARQTALAALRRDPLYFVAPRLPADDR